MAVTGDSTLAMFTTHIRAANIGLTFGALPFRIRQS
jgi:hypothetical protein